MDLLIMYFLLSLNTTWWFIWSYDCYICRRGSTDRHSLDCAAVTPSSQWLKTSHHSHYMPKRGQRRALFCSSLAPGSGWNSSHHPPPLAFHWGRGAEKVANHTPAFKASAWSGTCSGIGQSKSHGPTPLPGGEEVQPSCMPGQNKKSSCEEC